MDNEVAMSAVMQTMDEYSRITVEPISGSLGAEVSGVDITDLDQETYAEIHKAFLAHNVIFFATRNSHPKHKWHLVVCLVRSADIVT